MLSFLRKSEENQINEDIKEISSPLVAGILATDNLQGQTPLFYSSAIPRSRTGAETKARKRDTTATDIIRMYNFTPFQKRDVRYSYPASSVYSSDEDDEELTSPMSSLPSSTSSVGEKYRYGSKPTAPLNLPRKPFPVPPPPPTSAATNPPTNPQLITALSKNPNAPYLSVSSPSHPFHALICTSPTSPVHTRTDTRMQGRWLSHGTMRVDPKVLKQDEKALKKRGQVDTKMQKKLAKEVREQYRQEVKAEKAERKLAERRK